jgi:hypothetical protein
MRYNVTHTFYCYFANVNALHVHLLQIKVYCQANHIPDIALTNSETQFSVFQVCFQEVPS